MAKIIFDFDYTLFQTSKLRQAIKDFYLAQGVPHELFLETFEASRGTGRDWKPSIQLALIAQRHELDVRTCEAGIDACIRRCPEFFYEDSFPILENLFNDYQLFVVTYGEDSYQNAKIAHAGISHLFDRIVITQDITKVSALKSIIRNRGRSAFFVEDNPFALHEAKKVFPELSTVRINRGEGRYVNEPDQEGIDYTIKNLTKLWKIVKTELT